MAELLIGGQSVAVVEEPTMPIVVIEEPRPPSDTLVVVEEGIPGADGLSAYQLAEEEGFSGTIEQWLASLRGEDGTDGTDGSDGAPGDSAYEVAVVAGFSGNITQWLASLRGPKGDPGDPGTTTWAGITDKPTSFPPSAHTHPQSDVVGLTDALAAKAPLADMTSALTYLNGLADAQGAAIGTLQSGKADLVGGLVPTSQIPAIALTTGQAVANRAALLALTNVQQGDVGVITAGADKGTYILTNNTPSVFANWLLLSAPTDVVSSVNGQTGTVVLGKTDVGLGLADNTSDASKVVSGPQQAALDLKAALAGAAFTGAVSAPTVSATTSFTTPQATASVALLTAVRTTASARTSGVVLTSTSAELQFCDATAASFSIVLPSVTSTQSSRFTIKKVTAANVVTVGGTIDGATNYLLTAQWSWITVVSTQAANVWYIIAKG